MSIEKGQYQNIIENLKIGNSVAEFDFLLESARVETPVFDGVLSDRYDIILGRKGAGKTAMFKIITALSNLLLLNQNLVILSGVNSSGESLFNEFKQKFDSFTERDFENFWKYYFISLIYNEFIKDEKFQEKLSSCSREIEKFKEECQKAGIPNIASKQEKRQVVNALVAFFETKIKKVKVGVKLDSNSPNLFSFDPEIEFDNTPIDQTQKESVYINDIGRAIKLLLQKSGFKIWIVLDRLDEVFDRYSSTEFNGLRGLLLAYKSFVIDEQSDLLRIKLFLRDDIVDFLTDNKVYKKYFHNKNIPPLPAATHIFAKQSPILNWSEDEIEQLVLNRLLLNKELRLYIGLSENIEDEALKKILRVKQNRQNYWNKIFPEMISTSRSLKWVFTRLKDANGIVTPRSVIDMLEGAVSFQRTKMNVNYEDCENIFPVEAIKEGLKIASTNKLLKEVYNEFPNEQANIIKLGKEGKIKLTKTDLQNLYGKNWEDTVSTLNRIGIIRYVKDSKSYRVEFLFRPALNLTYTY